MTGAAASGLPAPTEASLHEAALNYLARYAATEAGLRNVLDHRIERWARTVLYEDRDALAARVAALKQDARHVVARLVASGLVNDAAYAAQRSASLVRSGRSRRAVVAGLAAKGVTAETARAVTPDDPDTELAAALVLARKRRIGPFRLGAPPDPAGRRRELATLARAGFAHSIASRALTMEEREAEELIAALRR